MTAAIAELTTIRSFGFNIPCRRFLIRANVARDRRLSVVDEFVLRALKLCEDVPVRRLATYFGFTAAETETVMADLASSGLVTVVGDWRDSISLHMSTFADPRTERRVLSRSTVGLSGCGLISSARTWPCRTGSAQRETSLT